MNTTVQEESAENADPCYYIAKMLKVAAVLSAPDLRMREKSNRSRELQNVPVRSQDAVEDRIECYDLLSRLANSRSLVSFVVMMKLCRTPDREIAATLQITRQRVNSIYQEFVSMARTLLQNHDARPHK